MLCSGVVTRNAFGDDEKETVVILPFITEVKFVLSRCPNSRGQVRPSYSRSPPLPMESRRGRPVVHPVEVSDEDRVRHAPLECP
mmetsp:Transcript_25054/g.49829  ORF Transcript_25054/g.49829 Transcript_25054/m.49829 type:complete len:84 (+) Transcript_25054:90-341(+)